jgi:hypothetical protein
MSQLDQLAANMAKISEQARIAGDRVKRLDETDTWLRKRVMALNHDVIKANAQRDKLAGLMQEAIDNCEMCRGETGARRCARCQTFSEALAEIGNEVPFESEAGS